MIKSYLAIFFFFDIIMFPAKGSFAKNLFESQEFMVYNYVNFINIF